MYNSNDYLAWQFVAILLLVIAILLAIANVKKQREINVCFAERLDLIRKCNKLMVDSMQLRNQLREKSDKAFEMEQKQLDK